MIYAQEIRQRTPLRGHSAAERGRRLKDERNLVWVAFDCHGAHHNRSRVLPLAVLPDSVFEFASELMGAAAFDYLRRRYRGEDARLEALLQEETR